MSAVSQHHRVPFIYHMRVSVHAHMCVLCSWQVCHAFVLTVVAGYFWQPTPLPPTLYMAPPLPCFLRRHHRMHEGKNGCPACAKRVFLFIYTANTRFCQQ